MGQTLNILRCGRDDKLDVWRRAALKNDVEKIRKLIKKTGYHEQEYEDEQPLDIAVQNGFCHLAKILIDTGIDVNSIRNNGLTLLEIYSNYGRSRSREMFDLLLDCGAKLDFDEININLTINEIIRGRDIEFLKLLLEKGLDINYKLGSKSLLEVAVISNSISIAKLLIENGADIEFISERSGTTILMRAISRMDIFPKALKILIKSGADIDARDFRSETPLMHSVNSLQSANTIFLIEQGADINIIDDGGRTALHHACNFNFSLGVNALLRSGAYVAASNTQVELESFFVSINSILIPYYLLHNPEKNKPTFFEDEGEDSEDQEYPFNLWESCRDQIDILKNHYLGESSISLHKFLCEHDATKLAYYLENDTSLLQNETLLARNRNFYPYDEMIEKHMEKGKKKRCLMLKSFSIINSSNLKILHTDIQSKLATIISDDEIINFLEDDEISLSQSLTPLRINSYRPTYSIYYTEMGALY